MTPSRHCCSSRGYPCRYFRLPLLVLLNLLLLLLPSSASAPAAPKTIKLTNFEQCSQSRPRSHWPTQPHALLMTPHYGCCSLRGYPCRCFWLPLLPLIYLPPLPFLASTIATAVITTITTAATNATFFHCCYRGCLHSPLLIITPAVFMLPLSTLPLALLLLAPVAVGPQTHSLSPLLLLSPLSLFSGAADIAVPATVIPTATTPV